MMMRLTMEKVIRNTVPSLDVRQGKYVCDVMLKKPDPTVSNEVSL